MCIKKFAAVILTAVILTGCTAQTVEDENIPQEEKERAAIASWFAESMTDEEAFRAVLNDRNYKSGVKKSDRKKAQRILTRSGLKKASQSRPKRKALNFLRIRKSEIFQKRFLTQCRTKKYCRIIYGISAGRCIPRRTPLTI